MFAQQYLRPTLSRLLVSLALLCASLAWGGWVFLHSVGDPHRFERIATSILDSPDARDEIALHFSDQLVSGIALDPAQKAAVTAAVSDVLGDPRIADNFVQAFGSAQANALGVDDPRPTVIDVGALVAVVREDLAATQPELAASIPVTESKVEIPRIRSQAVADVRELADRWTLWLAFIALIGLVSLMIFGDRRVVLRSFGFWAIMTGAFWAIGPRIAPWLAKKYAPESDALVKATVDAVAGPIITTATILFVLGVVAFVVRGLFFSADSSGLRRNRGRAVDQYGQPLAPASAYGNAAPMPRPMGPTYAPGAYQPIHAMPTVPVGYAAANTGTHPVQPPAPAVAPWQTAPEPVGQTPWPSTPTATVAAPQAWPANVPQPTPILLRPLDLPTSSDSLSSLADGDERDRR